MKYILALSLFLSAQVSALTIFDSAVISDSLTTYVAIDKGYGVEGNPLLPRTAAGATLVSAGLSYSARWLVRDASYCVTAYRALASLKLGAATNNVWIISGMDDDLQIPVGISFGFLIYSSKTLKKEAINYCGVA